MQTFKEARDFLDRYVLSYMAEMSSDSSDWTAFHLSAFVNEWVTKDMAAAICRDLRNRGLATFERGLFTEDGEPAGAGYTITKAGREYLETLYPETRDS
jgi:hypothetical protein